MAHLIEANWKELWGERAEFEPVGAIYTKPEVVEFILDMAGYTSAAKLNAIRILEPSCGDGAFIGAAISRIAQSQMKHMWEWSDPALDAAVTATDIDEKSLRSAKRLAAHVLINAGCPEYRALDVCAKWFRHTDFLLEPWQVTFDFVVGNPPYVRIEDLPTSVLRRYRYLYSAVTDRADLYVAFFQRGLELLNGNGTLAFICANRFTKNQYGTELRKLIAQYHRVKYYVNLEHTQPFLSDVSAYPAIFIIDGKQKEVTFANTIEGKLESSLDTLRREANGEAPLSNFQLFQDWYSDGSPWVSTSVKSSEHIRNLANIFPLLEDSAHSTRIGIGVATGADRVFVLPCFSTEIEPDRQIPLVMAGDVSNRAIDFSGHFLINPFAQKDDGSLVPLEAYPGLSHHFEVNRLALERRHVAKNAKSNWYRTIDRIWPKWQSVPKLLIPDIRGEATIGIDKGEYYPHHNLYWISSSWPLAVLKALLRSTFVHEQVKAFSVQMRGGALRFQAQTLRKIRIPALSSLSDKSLASLSEISTSFSQEDIDDAVDRVLADASECRVPA